MIKVNQVKIYHIGMRLKAPFQTSLGTVEERESLIIEVIDQDGVSGWGEVVAFSAPWYTEETIKTAYHILKAFLIPVILKKEIVHPRHVHSMFNHVKRNQMAKAGIELAIWDLFSKKEHRSLSRTLGGTRSKIEAGVVISIASIPNMLAEIEKYLAEGYKRFKVKINPAIDYELIKEIRAHFPELPLMADANSAYTLKDLSKLQRLDDFQLMMIEQPLRADDIVEHRLLQENLQTPICLDESIASFHDAFSAIQLKSCQIINIKAGRIGGLWEAKKVHDLCQQHDIQIWCGGMLETGISRAHNIALASLPHFTIPGDISSSSRYWEEDIIVPLVEVKDGTVNVPTGAGIGFEVNRRRLRSVAKHIESVTC